MNLFGADKNTLLNEAIDRAISGINTAIPGIIDSFDSNTQTASVVPAIQMKVTINEEVTYRNLPIIVNVPVLFPYAISKGFALTMPISKGDSCLLIFSQRAIDNWQDSGGAQPPEQNAVGCRHHSLSDAFAIMTPVSLPDALGDWNTDAIEIRNIDRDIRVTVSDSDVVVSAQQSVVTVLNTGLITIESPVQVSVTSPLVSINGRLTVSSTEIGAEPVEITTPLIKINGNLEVSGYIKDSVRKMSEDRDIYNSHTHDAPGGLTGVPNQQE